MHDIDNWTFSWHLRERARKRGYLLSDILDAVLNPETRYPAGPQYPGCMVATKGSVAVPYNPDSYIIITVLHNREDRDRD